MLTHLRAQLCAQVLSRRDTSLPSSISHPPKKLQQTSLKLLTNQFHFHLAINTCTVRLQYTDEVVSVLTINSCKLWTLNTSAWHLSEGDLARCFLDWRRWSSLWTVKTLKWVTVMIARWFPEDNIKLTWKDACTIDHRIVEGFCKDYRISWSYIFVITLHHIVNQAGEHNPYMVYVDLWYVCRIYLC